MNGKTFLDSNVLVYSVDESPAEKAKHERAIELLSAYPEDLVVSTQVLQEFYVVTTRKLKTPLTEERAARAVRGLAKLDVIGVDAPLVLAAVDTSRLVQLSFWDALIIEAASRAGCERVLSEDLNAGQVIHGVRIENPFADLKPVAIEGRSDLAEPLCAQLAPVGKLIAAIPAPRGDHRQHEDPALAQQVPIDTRIVLADFFGRMGEVEFDRPTATRLEVYEQQPVLRGEHVARVRLTME